VILGALIAVIGGVVFSRFDLDKVSLTVGVTVIGVGAALMPPGASAQASRRVFDLLSHNRAGSNGGRALGGEGAVTATQRATAVPNEPTTNQPGVEEPRTGSPVVPSPPAGSGTTV
jgi:hypothetical protein